MSEGSTYILYSYLLRIDTFAHLSLKIIKASKYNEMKNNQYIIN